jgi:hypothetical protein
LAAESLRFAVNKSSVSAAVCACEAWTVVALDACAVGGVVRGGAGAAPGDVEATGADSFLVVVGSGSSWSSRPPTGAFRLAGTESAVVAGRLFVPASTVFGDSFSKSFDAGSL